MTAEIVLAMLGGYAFLSVSARTLREAGEIWVSRMRAEHLQARREYLARQQERVILLEFAQEVNHGELRGMPPVDRTS